MHIPAILLMAFRVVFITFLLNCFIALLDVIVCWCRLYVSY